MTEMESTSVGVDLKASLYITKHHQEAVEIFPLQSLEGHIHRKQTHSKNSINRAAQLSFSPLQDL